MSKKGSKANIPVQEEPKDDQIDNQEEDGVRDSKKELPDQINEDPQELDLQEEEQSVKSWNLSAKEMGVLTQIQREVEETIRLAKELEGQATGIDPGFEPKANRAIEIVSGVVEAMKEDFSRNEADEEIKIAVESMLIRLLTKNKRLEQEVANLKDLVKERNKNVRVLVFRMKYLEELIIERDQQIERFEQQMSHLNRNVNKLQSKVDDEYRVQLIQEQLRQPKDKQSVAQQHYSQLLQKEQNVPLYLTSDQSKYIDNNVKDDGFDFWKSDGHEPMEYPGNPKRLHDVVNQKTLWVGKNEDDILAQFQFQKQQQLQPQNRVQNKREQDFWQG